MRHHSGKRNAAMKEYLSISETDALVEVESPDISPRAAFGKKCSHLCEKDYRPPGSRGGEQHQNKGNVLNSEENLICENPDLTLQTPSNQFKSTALAHVFARS